MAVISGLDLVIVTGLSGAGKTKTMGYLEDLGYYAMDNLPISLMSQFLDLALQNTTLDRCTDGHRLIRIDVAARFAAEELLDPLLHLGHPALSADQDDIVDVADLATSILQGNSAGFDGPFDEIVDQRLELGACDLQRQVLGSGGVSGNVRQVDFILLAGRKLDLGFFSGILEALQGQHVGLEVDARFFLELVDDVIDQALVEVFTAEEGVAVGRQHLKLVLAFDRSNFDD